MRGYAALEADMAQMLGAAQRNAQANERIFWTPEYQDLIRAHLAPHFARCGDIVEIARQAAESAAGSSLFNQPIAALTTQPTRSTSGSLIRLSWCSRATRSRLMTVDTDLASCGP